MSKSSASENRDIGETVTPADITAARDEFRLKLAQLMQINLPDTVRPAVEKLSSVLLLKDDK